MGPMRPYDKKVHDSIVRVPAGRSDRRPDNPFPVRRPVRKGRKKRGLRTVGEREQIVLAALEHLGSASSAEIADYLGEDMTTKLAGYSLGILREHGLVAPERVGPGQVWVRCDP